MCGRATLVCSIDDVVRMFAVSPIDLGPPRFNVAPGQPILTVRAGSAPGGRELAFARWGLIPWWAGQKVDPKGHKPVDEPKRFAGRCVQARAETVETAPAFRDAFRDRRCLVVVDGFFEWKTLPDGRRVPHHARQSDGAPFAIAGVWDTWRAPDGAIVESCAVLTTPAKGPIGDLHDRMPLVLEESAWADWLAGSAVDARRILVAAPAPTDLAVVPVSTWVNDVRHDDARCIEPIASVDAAAGQISFAFGPPK